MTIKLTEARRKCLLAAQNGYHVMDYGMGETLSGMKLGFHPNAHAWAKHEGMIYTEDVAPRLFHVEGAKIFYQITDAGREALAQIQ